METTAGMVGRCNGRGSMQSFKPVMVGSTYALTSVVSFFVVHPKGCKIYTKCGWGSVGDELGKYYVCSSKIPSFMLSYSYC